MANFEIIKQNSIIAGSPHLSPQAIKITEPSLAQSSGLEVIDSVENDAIELELHEMPHGPRCKSYTFMLMCITLVLLLWFGFAIIHFGLNGKIDHLGYILSECVANAVMVTFTLYIYIIYIRIPAFKRYGSMDNHDCTSFDVYAVFSLLWFLMIALLCLASNEYGYGFFYLLRMLAILSPGYIHKTYIRFALNYEHAASAPIYLGDIKLYKICCIIFLALQLFSVAIQLPLNTTFYQDQIQFIFHLDDNQDAFHFSFIIASVFGRPFVSIINFHLLVLYITWTINGDKPQTHHDLDLFTLALADSKLNPLFGMILMFLCVIDIIFNPYMWYRSFMLFVYVCFALYHFYFLVHEGRKTHRRMSQAKKLQHKIQESRAEIDIFTLFESTFVLIGGVLACVLYIANIDDFGYKFDAFSELTSWSVFMISQYIFVLFIQLDYVFGRKLLLRHSTQKMLSCSQLISAASVLYLFSFEYLHFVEHLTHHDAGHRSASSVTVSYTLFWCLLEYFIWSFVAINHMLHHIHEMQHLEHTQAEEKRRMTKILIAIDEQSKKKQFAEAAAAHVNANANGGATAAAYSESLHPYAPPHRPRQSYLFVSPKGYQNKRRLSSYR